MSAEHQLLTERYEREETARRCYTCDQCGGTIHKGDLYRVVTEVRDGVVIRWREHVDADGERCLPF
ncbi:MAG: hypothetical protein AAFV53_38220 [Myxococcota bacterium]